MSNEGETVLKRMLSSKVKGELLVLFHRNPGLMDDIEGIASRIGETPGTIKGELDDLISLGFLDTVEIGSNRVIYLDRPKDRDLLGLVSEHLQGLGR